MTTMLRPAAGPFLPDDEHQRRLSGTEFLLPLLSLVVLLAVPWWLFVRPVVESRPVSFGPPALLFTVMVVYCAVRLALLMWTAEPRWTVLGVWMFSYSWIGVAGLTQTLADANPLDLTLPQPLAVTQAALLLVGLLAFDICSCIRPGTPSRTRPTRVVSPHRAMVLAGVTLVLSPAFVAILGGPAVLLSSREAVNETLSDSGLYSASTNASGGLVTVFGGVLPFVAALCLFRLLVHDGEFRRRPLPWVFFVALIAVNALMNNPISNARYWAFAVILGVLFSLRIMSRPAVITVFVTVFAMSALVIFPYLDSFRYSEESVQQYNIQGNNFDQPVDYVLAKTDYGSVTDVAVAVRVVENQGLSWGRQMLGVVTWWMPRSVWPDKPLNTAFLVADEIGFVNRNLDSPLWAEGYVDFGWAGTVGLLGGFGLAARRLDDAFLRAQALRAAAVPLAAVAVPVIAGYEYILLRGSLLQAMARISMMLVLLAIVSVARPRSTA